MTQSGMILSCQSGNLYFSSKLWKFAVCLLAQLLTQVTAENVVDKLKNKLKQLRKIKFWFCIPFRIRSLEIRFETTVPNLMFILIDTMYD